MADVAIRQLSRARTISVWHILAALLVGLTILRMYLLVGAAPIIGFANNYDFIRQESCIGLWQHYPDREKTAAHVQAPVASLVFDGDRRRTMCVRSIDNLFPYLVTHTHRKHSDIDFRAVGFWKMLAAAALMVVLVGQPVPPGAKVALGVLSVLVIGDIDTLSYFNTFYTETSVILGGFACLGLGFCLMARPTPPRWRDGALLALAVTLLGLSKQQYSPLAAVMGVFYGWGMVVRWRAYRQGLAVMAIALLMPVMFHLINNPRDGLSVAIDRANRADTVFGAVLPAARDGQAAVRVLGLPDGCFAAIGKDWYTPGGNAYQLCPAVGEMGRGRLIGLFLTDPGTWFGPLWQGVFRSQPPSFDPYGRYARAADATLPVNRLLRATSLSFWLASMPEWAYGALIMGSILVGMACSGFAAWRPAAPGMALAALGGMTVFYAIASSVFGDGYFDFSRHAMMLRIGLAAQACGVGSLFHGAIHRLARHAGRAVGG